MAISEILCVRSSEVFSVYPKILADILQEETEKIRKGPLGKAILLPSDFEFKQKSYFRLLEKQRRINAAIERGEPQKVISQKLQWDPSFAFENLSSMSIKGGTSPLQIVIKQKCVADDPSAFLSTADLNLWNLDDIAKAGKKLHLPPLPCEFEDEQEMRRVYSLIYDVYRYKNILSQALNDVMFYVHFPELNKDQKRVWLLLFDLNLRHFTIRDPVETARKNILFKDANLLYIEKCLWDHRTKLAASISRLRIRNNALTLAQLLPLHLQDEKVAVAAANPIVSGWINAFKQQTNIIAKESLESINLTETPSDGSFVRSLQPNQYKFDRLCPQFLTCLPMDRTSFSSCHLIKNHDFIMQDRTFSLGPAIFARLLDYFELDGNVVQTHVASPKSTAYLASLFLCNNRVERFIAFGAGDKAKEFREYFQQLQITNVEIRAENFCKLSINSMLLDRVVGILATPPNSYTGIQDPIDLICSRGGDLSMLEVMTESEISEGGKSRVAEVLKEQRDTLKLAMYRPQTQFILYETHSIIDCENQKMVESVLDSINRAAREKHIANEKERRRQEAIAAAESLAIPHQIQTTPTSSRKRKDDEFTIRIKDSEDDLDNLINDIEEDEFVNIEVPLTDAFELANMPDICINQDKCLNPKDYGCYFALIKRKEVTNLDARYMIKIAEARGVFGSPASKKPKIKTPKKPDKKDVLADEARLNSAGKKLKRKRSGDLQCMIERLSQPTFSFLTHIQFSTKSSADIQLLLLDSNYLFCNRHQIHHDEFFEKLSTPLSTIRARKWWLETAKYMQSLRELNGRDRKLDLAEIRENVDSERIAPLRLQRNIVDRRYKNDLRQPYPLKVSDVEFHESEIPQSMHCSWGVIDRYNAAEFPPPHSHTMILQIKRNSHRPFKSICASFR